MTGQDAELLVLDLLEEVVDLSAGEREERVAERLTDRPDAQAVRARLTRLLEVEGGLGMVGDGLAVGPAVVAELTGASAVETLAPGTRVGELEVLELLGRGGMGAIYRARQERPAREVALKVLDRRASGDDLSGRLEREGHLLARLAHPGIAAVHAMGLDDGRPWIAMELVPGARTLTEHAAGLDRAARLELFDEVLAAVQHGHQKGVVHRDLKPDNLLVGSDGRPRVIDFGIAGLVEDAAEGPRRGPRFGSLAWMAPEALGEPGGHDVGADVRADVFALGLVLFELLLDRPARDLAGATTAEALSSAQEPVSVPTGALPRSLGAVLERALAPDPTRRYPAVEALRRDLRAWRDHRPVDAVLATGARFHALGCLLRRHRALAAGVALAFLGLAAGLVLTLEARERERVEHGRAEQQFARAELMRAAAIDISLDLVTDFAGEVARLSGGLETRRDMIRSGVEQLERLGAQAEGLGPGPRLDLAKAYLALGDVMGYVRGPNLGDFDRAEEAYDRSAALLAELVEGDLPGDFEAGLLGARLLERRATLLRARGDFPGAVARLEELDRDLVALAAAATSELDRARADLDRGQALYLRAGLVGSLGDHAGARDLARAAIALQEDLIARAPEGFDPVPPRFHLQQSWSFVAVASSQLGDDAAALEAFGQVRAVLDVLVAERPDDLVIRASRAGALVQEMDALRRAGRLERASELLDLGRVAYAELLEADPSDARSRSSAAFLEAFGGDVLLARARAAGEQGDEGVAAELERAARVAYDRAVDLFGALEAEGSLAGPGAQQLQLLLTRRVGVGE